MSLWLFFTRLPRLRCCIPQSSKRFRLRPYRMTLERNPSVYRWLWFNWYWTGTGVN